MPRQFPASIQGELNKQFGGEPMTIVDISWNGDSFVSYSDRKLNGEDSPRPLLIKVGDFDTATIISGGGESQSISVVMNDVDGSLREIIDTQDIHLRPVKVYLTFQGLTLAERALMFEGVINSPIEWDESGRTLSFTVFSKLEDSEAGFTMEDGDFPYVPPSESNKPWPLVFGQVCNMEAVRVSALRKGFLAQGIGVPDPTIEERLCQANKLQCAMIKSTSTRPRTAEEEKQYQITLNKFLNSTEMIQLSYCCNGDLTAYNAAKANYIASLDAQYNVTNSKPDAQCLQRRFSEICKILQERQQQGQYVLNPFTVRGGEDFPQGEKITIRIGDVKFDGTMTGESFYVTNTHHPDSDTIDNPPCKTISKASLGWRYGPSDNDVLPTNLTECENGGGQFKEKVVDGSGASWDYYNQFEAGSFIWLPAGTDVFLDAESDLVNVVSLIPGVVDQVAAYRTYGDTTLLTEVDPDLYTIVTSDFDGYEVVEVRMKQLLSNIDDEKWDDKIYVSFTSSVGPNPVDTIEWLVNKYTEYTVDPVSFAAVKSSLSVYPSNFFVKARPSAFQLIRDVAYQARCAVFIRDGIVYLVYLPLEPTSLRTLTEDDILNKTFKFSHTETEDLETRHEISWSNGEAGVTQNDPTNFTFVIKHNIPKYGLFDAEYDYYTQNTFDTVQKSATFWLIRNSNTWREVSFSTPVKHLDLDVFDCVTLDIDQFPTTKVVIKETKYDSESHTIRFKAWTPILSGTSTPYYWAWPSQQAEDAIWPLDGAEKESGDGYPFKVVPPEDHPLRGGYDPDIAQLATDGDKYPSDIGDISPTLSCPLATGAEIADDIEPIIRISEPLAEKNFQSKLDGKEAENLPAGGGGGSDENKEQSACGQPAASGGGCVYEVTVSYISPDLQQDGSLPHDGTGGCGGGPCNKDVYGSTPCTGAMSSQCHSFGALFAATMFRSQKQQEIANLKANCGYNYQEWAPYSTGWLPIKAIPGEGAYGECEDVSDPPGDPDAPAANAGETRQMSPQPGSEPIAEYLRAQADAANVADNPGTVNNPGDAI